MRDADTLISQLIQIVKYVSQTSNLSVEERTATILQYHTLSFLKKQPEAKLSDVAKHLHASLSGTTQLIERMYKAGLVTRNNDEKDRRIIRLSLTVEGNDKLGLMHQEKQARMKTLLANLEASEIKDLLRIQEKLIKHIQ